LFIIIYLGFLYTLGSVLVLFCVSSLIPANLRWDLMLFFGAASDHDLLCTWDYKYIPPHPAFWLRWGLTSFSPKLALKCSPPNLHLLSSWDNRCEPPFQALVICFYVEICPYLGQDISSTFMWGPSVKVLLVRSLFF
jgi:hypothetical protein